MIGQESPECVIVELGAIVSNDGLGYSKTTLQVSPKKVDYFFSGDCGEGLCLNPFCVVIHNDNGVLELSRGCGELSDEIESPLAERDRRDDDREGYRGMMCKICKFVALKARLDDRFGITL